MKQNESKYKMQLQLFAGEENEENEAENEAENNEENMEEAKIEINESALKSRIERAKEKAVAEKLKELGVESIDDVKSAMQKIKEIEDANKSDLEKLQAEKEELNAKMQELQEKATKAEYNAAIVKAGVKSDYADDVLVLAKQKVSDEKDINAAINEIVEKYPHFKGEQSSGFKVGTESKDKKKPSTDDELMKEWQEKYVKRRKF